MNSNCSSDEIVFTDNIIQSFKSYKPSESSKQKEDALQEGEYLKGRMALYMQKINQLRQNHYTLKGVPAEKQKLVKSLNFAFKTYFHVHLDYSKAILDGGGYLAASREYVYSQKWLQDQISTQEDQKILFNCINRLAYLDVPFFGDLSTFWDVRFSYVILEQIQSFDEAQLDALFYYLAIVRRGVIFLHTHIGTDPKNQNWVLDDKLAYSVIFCEAFSDKNAIVGAIMPVRVPQAKQEEDTKPGACNLEKFNYSQYLYFSEFMKIHKILQIKGKYDQHKTFIKEDSDLYKCFEFGNTNLRYDRPQNALQVAVQYKRLFDGDFLSYQIKPLRIFNWMLKEPSIHQFQYDAQARRWIFVAQNSQHKAEKAFEEKKAQEKIISKIDQKENQEKLIKILDSMPTLKVRLSDLQKQVVGSTNNLLCLGRSGTGKTTTTVLRLFSQELLYKLYDKQRLQQLEEIKEEVDEEQSKEEGEKVKKFKAALQSTDIDKTTAMKMVFITASPVLTNEVRRFYGNLKANLKAHLKRKEDQKQEIEKQKEKQETQDFEKIEGEEDKKDEGVSFEDQEKKELLEFMKREEKELVEDIQMDESMNVPNAYEDLKPQHFPLFMTIKKLVLMMDACLSFSFFSRDHRNNIIGLDSNLGWHNESKGVMMINHYYKENIDYNEQLAKFGKEILEMDKEVELNEDSYKDLGDNFFIGDSQQANSQTQSQKYMYSYSHNRVNEKYILERQQLSFEVDYDIFEQRFWPKIVQHKNLKKLSPTLVWTEIYSVIKGGKDAQSYYMGYLPRQYYLQTATDFLSPNERKTIYFIFLEYEKWKSQQHAYDFMDVVNHVIKRLWYGDLLRRMSIDYLIVDEVQDLTPKALQLLLRLTKHKVFFAGDTAQTIAKGVGARFHDLRSIFSQLSVDVPKIVQLTKNYRSHGRILDLANSVVSVIELFFPKTIDRLVKEESDLDGLKPLVIMPLDGRNLKNLFLGASISSAQSSLASPQFGCNQVLIVRDQEAKNSIPDLFKNMLCLTVYESKGLEFDDVILYNFFHLGDVNKSAWKLLNDIIFEQVRRVKYSNEILDFDMLDIENFENLKKIIKAQEEEDDAEYEYETQLTTKTSRHEVYRKFSMLCIELKFLYVAITRPKKRLLIYDDVADGRKPIQQFWEKMGAIQVITKDMISEENRDKLAPEIRSIFEAGALKSDLSSTDEWRIQGIKLFKKKYYESAIKCFQFSEDQDLVHRCYAYQEAEAGSAKLTESQGKIWRAKVLLKLQKADKKKLLKEAKKLRNQASLNFQSAGRHFSEIGMKKHAASCFFTGQKYLEAATIFEQLEQFGQAAECLLMEQEYVKAARLFEKAHLVSKSIECYELASEWEQLLHCLHRNKDFFKQEERESLVNKYVPVALNSLYRLYSQTGEEGEELDEENKGKLQEMKMKLKYQKKVNVIEEEDEEGLSSDADSDDQEEQKTDQTSTQPDPKPLEDKPEAEEDEEMVDIVSDEGDDGDPGLLEEVFQIKRQQSEQAEQEQKLKEQEEAKDTSFEMIDTTTKKEDETKKEEEVEGKLEDFEHLSQYDPDDEFLRSSRSVSIIESIISQRSISKTSDFSIISSPKSKINSSISIITTNSKRGSQIAQVQSNRDIYAEDVITQKIIYYVSLFSEEVSEHLKKLRSNKVLTHNKEDKAVNEQDFLIDLDEVDSSFINLILDVLEYYELFRLCLMICNRYHMSERLGRYIISVCSKYSNLNLFRFNLELNKKVFSINFNWFERQRHASILSHEAIHNVFTLIEPKFLSLKDIGEGVSQENSLGNEAYRMMFDLGFWKKLVYITDGNTAIQLCRMFSDRENFEILKEHLSMEKLDQKLVGEIEDELTFKQVQLELFQKEMLIPGFPMEQGKYLEIIQSYEQDPKFGNQIQSQLRIVKWLFQEKRFKISAKSKLDKDQKMQDEFYKNLEKEGFEIGQLFESIVKNKSDIKNQYLLLLLSLACQTQYMGPLMENLKYYFELATINSIFENFLSMIKILNLEDQPNMTKQQIDSNLNALYAVYLVSQFESSSLPSDLDVFKHYKHNYLLVNISSPLVKDIQALQVAFTNQGLNLYLEEQIKEMRTKFFKVKNFQNAVIRQFKDFQKNVESMGQLETKYENAFMIDMDAQYMVVPKIWIDKLLVLKLLQMTISLEIHLRQAIRMGEDPENRSIEDIANNASQQIQVYSKINTQVIKSYQLHQPYISDLLRQQEHIKAKLLQREEYRYIVQGFWQKVQFNPINFENIYSNAAKTHTGNEMNNLNFNFDSFVFSLGFNHKQKSISRANGILKTAFSLFDQAVDHNSLIGSYSQNYEDENLDKRLMLQKLMESFHLFMICDQYEIMVELIKSRRRQMEKRPDAYFDHEIQYLKKFMIAIDIHVYLKKGCWALAVDSIFQFLQYFYNVLSYEQRVHLVELGFYLSIIHKIPLAYLPDNAQNVIRVLTSEEKSNLYSQVYELEATIDKPEEQQGRQIQVETSQQLHIDKYQKDAGYNEGLYWVIKIIEELNEDEVSSAKENVYKRLYNIMMSATINDEKKSKKTVDQLAEAFNNLLKCPFEEYFLTTLQDYDLTTLEGFSAIANDFLEWDETLKHEFFAYDNYSSTGAFVIYLDTSKRQAINVDQVLNKLFIKESQILAKHLLLSMKLKKIWKKVSLSHSKTHHTKQVPHALKSFSQSTKLEHLLSVPQLPTYSLLTVLKDLNLRTVSLKQLIVVKYALNSLDIHYILGKVIECDSIGEQLIDKFVQFYQKKGAILKEYVEVDNQGKVEEEDLELKQLLETQKAQLSIIQEDIFKWMNVKAEPNLIEVEIKSQKYKLKWESLNLFEKKEMLKALLAKQKMVQQAA